MSEHMSTISDRQPYGELTYTVLFESTSGTLHATQLTFAEGDDPEKLAVDIASACKKHINHFKRTFYRGILLKKPVVSIVKVSGVTDLSRLPGTGQILLQNKVHDPILSSALRNPTVLRSLERDAFCHEYKNIFLESDDFAPKSAVLIHHINDPTASKVVGIAGSVFSITLGLVGAFVL